MFDASCQWLRDARNAAVVQSWLPAASEEAACTSGYHLKQNVAPDADALPNSTGTACIACAVGMFSIENAKECIACFPGNGIAVAVAVCRLPLMRSGQPAAGAERAAYPIGPLAPAVENVYTVDPTVQHCQGTSTPKWRRANARAVASSGTSTNPCRARQLAWHAHRTWKCAEESMHGTRDVFAGKARYLLCLNAAPT